MSWYLSMSAINSFFNLLSSGPISIWSSWSFDSDCLKGMSWFDKDLVLSTSLTRSYPYEFNVTGTNSPIVEPSFIL